MAEPCILAKYQVLHAIGEGGMGRVYLAQPLAGPASERVVVKVMHEKFISKKRFHELFEREMGFLRRFQHPNVVALLDYGVDPEFGPSIVMEYLDGLPLCDVLEKQGRLPPDRVGRLLVQLCSGLQAAHNRGIIHRDLKPSNMIVLRPGTLNERLKMLDFGLATLNIGLHLSVDELRGTGRQFLAVGTPDYMNPEQLRGNEVDHRGDLYSVGVMLFELLTGQRPFLGADNEAIMEQQRIAAPPHFEKISPGIRVPPGIEPLVMACMAKYPMDRPSSARDLAERFQKAMGINLLPEDFETPVTPIAAMVKQTVSALRDLGETESAVVFRLQAWMPEKIAVVKLRGFLDDLRGDVSESQPGLVRMSLRLPPEHHAASTAAPQSLLSWLGLGKKPDPRPPPPRVPLDLYMDKGDPQSNLLNITVVLRPPEHAPPAFLKDWTSYCNGICKSLCSHLIATKVENQI